MPVKDLILSAALRIGIDKNAAAQGVSALRNFRQELTELEAHAKNLREVLDKGASEGIDDQTLKKVREGLKTVEKEMVDLGNTISDQMDNAFQKADRALYKTERIGMNLFQAAGALQEISQSLTFEDQLRQFEQLADVGDKVAKRNAEINASIASSQSRIGRVVAESWTPILEQTDKFQQNLATFIESNPELLQIAVNVGSVVSSLSGVANAIGRGLRIYADIKQVQISTTQLLAANIMEKAAQDQLRAAGIQAAASKGGGAGGGIGSLLGKVGAAAGGIALGAGIYDATIGKSQGTSAGDILGKGAAIFSGTVKSLLEGQRAGQKAFLDTAKMYGVIADEGEDANQALDDTGQTFNNFTLNLIKTSRQLKESAGFLGSNLINQGISGVLDQMASITASTDPAVKAFAEYREEVLDAEQEYDQERAKIVVDGNLERLKQINETQATLNRELQAFDKSQQKDRLDLVKQESADIKNLLAERAKALDEFNQAELDTEEAGRRQRLKDLAAFVKDEAKTAREQDADRIKAVAALAKEEAAAEKDQERQRLKDLADFLRSEAETEVDYYAQRLKDTLAAQRDDLQQQADHDKAMLRMAEDYEDSLSDLTDERDAFGLIKAAREHQKERSRAEQDYREQVSQRDEQRAQQLADQEADFVAGQIKRREDFERRRAEDAAEQDRLKEERRVAFAEQQAEQQAMNAEAKQERALAFKERLDEEDAQRQEERTQRLADFNERRDEQLKDAETQRLEQRRQLAERQAEQRSEFNAQQAMRASELLATLAQSRVDQRVRLDELDTQYSEEKAKRERDFKDRLNEIDDSLTGERDTRRKYYKQMADDLEVWLGGLRSNTEQLVESIKTSAQDIANLGQNLIANAAQGIGGFFGGASANAPAGAFAGVQAGGTALVLQQNFSFDSSLNESEKAWYKQTAYDQAVNAFDNVISGRK
jgi:hypothetical protein